MRHPRPHARRSRPPASHPTRASQRSPLTAGRAEERGPSLEYSKTPAELAAVTAELAARACQTVEGDHRRPDRIIPAAVRANRTFTIADRLFITRSIDAMFRWRGWIDPLRLGPIEARLLVAVLLDWSVVPEPCRVWARSVGVNPRTLHAIGGAPTWARRAEAFRRLVENPRATTDPWALFPRWLHEELLEPPGDLPVKHRLADLLHVLQCPPRPWVRVARGRPEAIWREIREQGCSPQIHPRLKDVASLDSGTLLQGLEAFRRGDLVSQDLSSVAIIACCDAEAGERWWYAGQVRGEKAVLMAKRMAGKGTIVVGDLNGRARTRTARMARGTPYSNVSTRIWDGRRVIGKPESYHGVLLVPPSSGLGLWRREPAARWLIDQPAFDRLVSQQAQLLNAAATAVRPGGVLVYAVPSLARSETTAQIERFLDAHPEFTPDPFPDPLDGSPTEGEFLLWPDRVDSDACYVARLIRAGTRASDSNVLAGV